MTRKDDSNDADAKSDGLVRMTKDMESKFKLLLIATMMKNQNHGTGDAGNTIQRSVIPTENDNGNGKDTSTTNGANTTTKTKTEKIKENNNDDVKSTERTMEDTTTTSNDQNAGATSGTNLETKECVGTSNKIDNTGIKKRSAHKGNRSHGT